MKTVIYGATDTGKNIFLDIKDSADVILFLDDDPRKWGGEIDDVGIENPLKIRELDFDEVIVGVLTYRQEVYDRLISFGISPSKINTRYVDIPTYARIECLKSVAKLTEQESIAGSVAELGVFRGEFAKEINRVFPDRKLYLFDTFEGFDERDTDTEVSKNYADVDKKGYFSNTSEEYVLSQMKYPEMCMIRKGFFPETVEDIEDSFCFVNLDADLYAPTISGLRWFYPRMERGGVILVHDFFSRVFHGIKDAVREFCEDEKIAFFPIGDTLSVGIRKI